MRITEFDKFKWISDVQSQHFTGLCGVQSEASVLLILQRHWQAICGHWVSHSHPPPLRGQYGSSPPSPLPLVLALSAQRWFGPPHNSPASVTLIGASLPLAIQVPAVCLYRLRYSALGIGWRWRSQAQPALSHWISLAQLAWSRPWPTHSVNFPIH